MYVLHESVKNLVNEAVLQSTGGLAEDAIEKVEEVVVDEDIVVEKYRSGKKAAAIASRSLVVARGKMHGDCFTFSEACCLARLSVVQ